MRGTERLSACRNGKWYHQVRAIPLLKYQGLTFLAADELSKVKLLFFNFFRWYLKNE